MQSGSPTFVRAFAKINLTLDVLGRRADGYHALRSVMQTIALHDTLAVAPRADGRLVFTCDEPELAGTENLALRAAEVLRRASGARAGAEIELSKTTPVQAGLGGGSSDGATALSALNALWRLGYDHARLTTLAAQLGSDVPFFIHGGTALIEGRGEDVHPLRDAEPFWLVLVKPAIGLSTKDVFGALRPEEWSDGGATQALVEDIEAGRALAFERFSNALEPGVLRAFPAVARAREALLDAGAPVARMSGSGPTVFAPFRRLAEASAVLRALSPGDYTVWLTRTVPR